MALQSLPLIIRNIAPDQINKVFFACILSNSIWITVIKCLHVSNLTVITSWSFRLRRTHSHVGRRYPGTYAHSNVETTVSPVIGTMCQNVPAASRICSSSSSSSFWSTACWDYRVLNSARLRLKSGVDTTLILQVKYDGVLSSLFIYDSNRFHTLGTMQGRGIREPTSKEDEANQNRASDTEPALSQKQGQNLFIADEFTFTSNSHLSLLMQFRLCTPKGTVIGLGHSGLKINSINMWNNTPIFSRGLDYLPSLHYFILLCSLWESQGRFTQQHAETSRSLKSGRLPYVLLFLWVICMSLAGWCWPVGHCQICLQLWRISLFAAVVLGPQGCFLTCQLFIVKSGSEGILKPPKNLAFYQGRRYNFIVTLIHPPH